MKMVLTLLIGGLFILLAFIAWAGYPWSLNSRKSTVESISLEPKEMNDPEEHPAVIKIMTWNIGFLYGKGSEGPGYEYKPKEFYDERLKKIASQIKEWNADIICLQEIDFKSHRSHGIDQAQFIAMEAGYPYVAEATSWDANYIPFPYWPTSRHFGSMKSGGAILSKYPIVRHEVELLAKPASHAWWYNIFYLHRYLQNAVIQVGETKFSVVNLHLEAFDKSDRQTQIRHLLAKIKSEKVDFVAGDFNMVPASAAKKRNFPQSTDDYENDRSFELMRESGMLEAIPEEIYSKDESLYFTFPSWKPDRRLDYIFYRQNRKMMRAEVMNSNISDHLPLRASFQIGTPKYDIYSQ